MLETLEKRGSAYWVDKLSTVDMPVLASVVQHLTRLTGNDETEMHQLSEVILKDPHLTSQVLKIANSVQYNPVGTSSISTVSRAIVMLGFRGVRSVCISLMVIDTLLKGEPKKRLLESMARAFYAAVQAQTIYQQLDQKQQEEVFIAALLYNLGEMAFWAYGGGTAEYLAKNGSDERAIEKVLGTNFTDISRELGKVWKLGDTLQEALARGGKVSARAQAVRLGGELSQLAADDEEGRKKLLRRISDLTHRSVLECQKMVNDAAEKAAQVAEEYGAQRVCHMIPGNESAAPERKKGSTIHIMQTDAQLQLKVLQDMANSVADQVDVNTVFQMALEGIHRGVGLERVMLALFLKQRLKCKYVLGQSTDSWRDEFDFDLDADEPNVFKDIITKPQPVWIDEVYILRHRKLYNPKIMQLIGRKPALVGVLRIRGRRAALFYADRGKTSERISREQFDAFKLFLNQAEMSIQAIANSKKG